MIWKVKEAQDKFPELINAAEVEPQSIYDRDRLVAVLVKPITFQKFIDWQQSQPRSSLSETLTLLTEICEEENYVLEFPARIDRSNPFD
jgi:hypothetical protein